jgi:type II secretory pathway pseudopilin PulG
MFALGVASIVALAIVVAVVGVLLIAVIPRMRGARAERRLRARREEVAGQHRAEAQDRERRAELAETEARRARAEAEMHEQEARLHDEGLADERLAGDEPGAGRFQREADRPAVERDREYR